MKLSHDYKKRQETFQSHINHITSKRKMGGPSSSKSSNQSGLSEIPMTGRELAIEALIDLDPRGPQFRINRMLVSFCRDIFGD